MQARKYRFGVINKNGVESYHNNRNCQSSTGNTSDKGWTDRKNENRQRRADEFDLNARIIRITTPITTSTSGRRRKKIQWKLNHYLKKGYTFYLVHNNLIFYYIKLSFIL